MEKQGCDALGELFYGITREVLAADEPLANRSPLHPGRGAAPTSQKQKKEKKQAALPLKKDCTLLKPSVYCVTKICWCKFPAEIGITLK
jgi:hypothetical protein